MFKDRVNFQKTLFSLTSMMTLTKFTDRKYIHVDKLVPNNNSTAQVRKKLINISQIILQNIGATLI